MALETESDGRQWTMDDGGAPEKQWMVREDSGEYLSAGVGEGPGAKHRR